MQDMSKYGKRWICVKCDARFYDLNKAEPICPKCGHNQLLDIVTDDDFFADTAAEEEKDAAAEREAAKEAEKEAASAPETPTEVPTVAEGEADTEADADEEAEEVSAKPVQPLDLEEALPESDEEAAQEAIGEATKTRRDSDASGDSDDGDDF